VPGKATARRQEPDVYKVEEVARRLQVSKNHVYELVKNGQLRHVRLGVAIRVPRSAVEDLLEGRGARTA
jgi:excisionase family DNA binding protein